MLLSDAVVDVVDDGALVVARVFSFNGVIVQNPITALFAFELSIGLVYYFNIPFSLQILFVYVLDQYLDSYIQNPLLY